MSSFIRRFKTGRFVWTVLVTLYFFVFFTNFFRDAIPDRMTLPVLFAYIFVLWLSFEYYFGSPFFQSGVVEHSALWRGIFAFFVYPFLAYLGADFIWWHWTQMPVPVAVMTTVLPLVPNRAESKPCPPIIIVAAVASVTVAAPMPSAEPSVPTPIDKLTLVVVLVLVARMNSDLQSITDCAVVTEKVIV